MPAEREKRERGQQDKDEKERHAFILIMKGSIHVLYMHMYVLVRRSTAKHRQYLVYLSEIES